MFQDDIKYALRFIIVSVNDYNNRFGGDRLPSSGAAAARRHGKVYGGKLAYHERGDCLVNMQHLSRLLYSILRTRERPSPNKRPL